MTEERLDMKVSFAVMKKTQTCAFHKKSSILSDTAVGRPFGSTDLNLTRETLVDDSSRSKYYFYY